MSEKFLPLNRAEMEIRGWDRPDFILVTGDAYVDHPSYGASVIARVLEKEGFRVAILAQPDWKDPEAFKAFGRPRLAFLVTSGNMDSMVSNYTAARKARKEDVYSPGGETGRRPDRATIVYSAAIKQTFKKIPVIIGGMESSLRRLAHFDYWSSKVRRSILLDAKADLLVYGMGEEQIVEIARKMDSGVRINQISHVRGTVYKASEKPEIDDALFLPGYKEICNDNKAFARSFQIQHLNTDPYVGKTLIEPYGTEWIVQNPPAFPLSGKKLDEVYELPYAREAHSSYEGQGKIKALDEVMFSLVSSRGCFGGCSFCALNFHQGRIISARSRDSLVNEARSLISDPRFKGYIHDVGGPTANFRRPACSKQLTRGACPEKQCLSPEVCPAIEVDHSDYLVLLRELRSLDGVKKVFIRSGIRYDYLILDEDETFFRELVQHHISGQLKVAPEHISDRVLKIMGKPGRKVFDRFREQYERINREEGKKQYLVPYLISSHPGSTLEDAVELAEYLRDTGLRAEQVQDFIPTPGTLSTAMYYSGYDPLTMRKVHVVRDPGEKAMQRALLQYRKPQNRKLVEAALRLCGREDLIGTGESCLIRGDAYPGDQSSRAVNRPNGHESRDIKSLGKKNNARGNAPPGGKAVSRGRATGDRNTPNRKSPGGKKRKRR